MFAWLNETLYSFESCFSRKASFKWFVITTIAFMIRTDHIGITSIIREFGIVPVYYESIIHFFHASSWTLMHIKHVWVRIINGCNCLFLENNMPILVGDGVKQSKEARKMPGVKKLHQESENSSKSEYIFGHLFGVIGVLIGNCTKMFSVPVSATIHDGVSLIRKWDDPGYEPVSHVVQIIIDACSVSAILGHSILLLDRYFLSVPALKQWLSEETKHGKSLLTIITKAKMSAKAYETPVAKKGKGRPAKRGDPIKLKDLFTTHINDFKEASVFVYGKATQVTFLCKDLLWGNGLNHKLRFVLVNMNGIESILVSTNLTFTPEQIIRLYSYRFKIEVCFRTLKQTIAGFFYHFWSKSMPKLNRFLKNAESQKKLESINEKASKKYIVSALKAIEGYVMFSCIALGLLQIIALKFSKEIHSSNFRWLRTKTNEIPSEATIADFMRKFIFYMLHKISNLGIIQIIKSKQFKMLDSSDTYIA